jgi:hypothetical protein
LATSKKDVDARDKRGHDAEFTAGILSDPATVLLLSFLPRSIMREETL